MNPISRGRALAPLCLLLNLGACSLSPSEPPKEQIATHSDALLTVNCYPPISQSAPFCLQGDRTCGGTWGAPLCCYDGSHGEKCLIDPDGNAVVCGPLDVRCGVSCTSSLADCNDPVFDGHCNLLYANSGLCWGNCYDKDTEYCDGTVVCPLGEDCSPGGETQCLPGQSHCGNTCYWPSRQTCQNGVVCSLAQEHCGNTCFDPFGNLACFHGVLCNRFTYDDSCGGVCIDSSVDHCVSGTVCPLAKDGACGDRCYNTATHKCCSGSDIYDPDVSSCCDGQVYSGQVTKTCGQCVYAHAQPFGGPCTTDLECKVGKCSNLTCGLGGECVCDTDADCGPGKWCDQGTLTIGKNSCKALKDLGDVCTRGGQCESNCCKLHIATNPFSPVCRPADKC